MSMRVLHVARTLTVGGIEPHLMALGSGLQSAGWQVAIASSRPEISDARSIDWFTSRGFRHYEISFPGPDLSLDIVNKSVRSAMQFGSVIADFCPDVIHVHYRATSIYAYFAQLLAGIPAVSTLHIVPIPSSWLYRKVSFWGKRTIAISSESRDYLKNTFKLRDSQIRLIHHGVDAEHYRPPTRSERESARATLGVQSEPIVIAMLARMSEEKGHDILLNALAQLKEKGHRIAALLAGVSISGDTSWRETMMKMALDLGIADQVHFLGFTDARQVLWASDIAVLPSRREGFPLAVIEAMLSGLVPLRTAAAGAYDQIEDGKTGFIVPVDDSSLLAQRLLLLLENEKRRQTMALAARAAALSRFSVDRMVTQTSDLYNEVLRLQTGNENAGSR